MAHRFVHAAKLYKDILDKEPDKTVLFQNGELASQFIDAWVSTGEYQRGKVWLVNVHGEDMIGIVMPKSSNACVWQYCGEPGLWQPDCQKFETHDRLYDFKKDTTPLDENLTKCPFCNKKISEVQYGGE